jgi:D-serine dehydratase
LEALIHIAAELGDFPLTANLRGVPTDELPLKASDVAQLELSPADGRMNLPLLSLDIPTYEANRSAMLRVCKENACKIAPHAKTPMSPVLARDLVEHGAWGPSVADLRQADAMLRHRLQRVLIANEIGGRAAAQRLATLLRRYPDSQVFLFIDSTKMLSALGDIWKQDAELPVLRLLIDVGCGRGGTNSQGEVEALLQGHSKIAEPRFILAGVACYEGTANRPDATELDVALTELFNRTHKTLGAVRAAVGPDQPLILSAGGSSLFDEVISRCSPILQDVENCALLLRSGACFFSDHGPIRDRLRAVASRKLLSERSCSEIATAFSPALRLWAEVLSAGSNQNVICGVGLRDVAHDQGLPVPVALWRDGAKLAHLEGAAETLRLNDQHAFVRVTDVTVDIGDVIEFGIRHPCTTIDKHDLIYGLNSDGKVVAVLRTFFG